VIVRQSPGSSARLAIILDGCGSMPS
jgi:hypothetical protein